MFILTGEWFISTQYDENLTSAVAWSTQLTGSADLDLSSRWGSGFVSQQDAVSVTAFTHHPYR